MKIADSYITIKNYQRASKQLLKVIKSSPNYLPARIGYASALEAMSTDKTSSKNTKDIALTYAEAAIISLSELPDLESTSSAIYSAEGDGGMPEMILRKALESAMKVPSKGGAKLEVLQTIVSYAHTAVLASDTYHEIGVEAAKLHTNSALDENDLFQQAREAFLAATEYATLLDSAERQCRGSSLKGLGELEFRSGGPAYTTEALNHLSLAVSCLSTGSAEQGEAIALLEQAKVR
jgi:tetratricopeptide (TPR) repeat protein